MAFTFDTDRVSALLEALAPERLTRVVDIGANPLDDPPYGPLKRLGGCEVWGFEPQKDAFDKLVEEAGENEHYIHGAVGDGKEGKLNIFGNGAFTSLLKPNAQFPKFLQTLWDGFDVVDNVTMQTAKLDRFDMPQVDLVKIDIQGGERDVFRHGKRQLKGALAVITEVAAVPLYEDQPLLDVQMAELRKTGYHLHKFLFFKEVKLRHKANGNIWGPDVRSQLLDGDAVFVQSLMDFREMDTERLKHLCVLADAVFASPDLATAGVGILAERGAVTEAFSERYAKGVRRNLKGRGW